MPDFEDYLKKLVEATDQAAKDTYWNTFAPGFGATPRQYGVRIPMNWVDLDTPYKSIPERLKEAFGERKGAKIYADGQAAITTVETSIRRNRADLSHIASE